MSMPSLFLSHGAPTLPLTDTRRRARFSKSSAARCNGPRPLVVASAHWETRRRPSMPSSERDDPRFLWLPATALRPALRRAGLAGRWPPSRRPAQGGRLRWRDRSAPRPRSRRLGAAAVLIYPQADIPVLQLSIQPHLGPAHHLRIGRALAGLRRRRRPDRRQRQLHPRSFRIPRPRSERSGAGLGQWFCRLVRHGADARTSPATCSTIAGWRLSRCKNHPTEEHLLPLYVALGAAGEHAHAERLHASATYGVLRMDVYSFDDHAVATQPA